MISTLCLECSHGALSPCPGQRGCASTERGGYSNLVGGSSVVIVGKYEREAIRKKGDAVVLHSPLTIHRCELFKATRLALNEAVVELAPPQPK